MADYNITKSNGDPIVITDNTIDNSQLSTALIGQNTIDFGDDLNANIVHLLENFAFDTEPANPTNGQLWYDTTTGFINVYDGVDFNELSTTQLEANTADVATLQGQVSTLESEVTSATTNITILQGQVSTLESDVVTLESDISTLQSEVSFLQGQVSTLESDIATLEANDIISDAKIVVLENQVSTLQDEVETATTGLLDRVTALENP